MPPGQIDGLELLKADSLTKGRGQSPDRRDSGSSSLLHLHIPGTPSPADLAMSAMQYLPYPMVVLNGLKTVSMANEAMVRLLELEEDEDTMSDDATSGGDRLRGQTLSQMGIDMLEHGRPVWVTWESFLDSIAEGLGTRMEDDLAKQESESGEGGKPVARRIFPISYCYQNFKRVKSTLRISSAPVLQKYADLIYS